MKAPKTAKACNIRIRSFKKKIRALEKRKKILKKRK